MELSCEIKVEEVLIGKNDLTILFRRLEEIAKEIGNIDERDKVYTLHFDNGTKISDSNFKIFESYPKQGKSRPIKIEATITSRKTTSKSAAHIYCEIEHGNGKWGKKFVIRSNESSNFEHLKSCINNSIESFEPQKKWIKDKRAWSVAVIILQAIFIFLFLDLTKHLASIYTLRIEDKNLSAEVVKGNLDISLVVLFLAVQWLPVNILMGKLEDLAKESWPSIEINIGENWQRKEAIRRSFTAYIFAVFIFPVILLMLSK